MSIFEQLTTALRALREVEEEQGVKTTVPDLPIFTEAKPYLDQLGDLPSASLLFGAADDGLPILLDLHEPRTGPILILGDAESGKTGLLQAVLKNAIHRGDRSNVQFAVLTQNPDDWSRFESDALIEVVPMHPREARDLFFHASAWMDDPDRDPESALVLLIDGLDVVSRLDVQTRESFTWLLQNGLRGGVWILVTLNATLALDLPDYLSFFHTRIYGKIENSSTSVNLTPIPGAALHTLLPGAQFALRERSHWLRFWLLGE